MNKLKKPFLLSLSLQKYDKVLPTSIYIYFVKTFSLITSPTTVSFYLGWTTSGAVSHHVRQTDTASGWIHQAALEPEFSLKKIAH